MPPQRCRRAGASRCSHWVLQEACKAPRPAPSLYATCTADTQTAKATAGNTKERIVMSSSRLAATQAGSRLAAHACHALQLIPRSKRYLAVTIAGDTDACTHAPGMHQSPTVIAAAIHSHASQTVPTHDDGWERRAALMLHTTTHGSASRSHVMSSGQHAIKDKHAQQLPRCQHDALAAPCCILQLAQLQHAGASMSGDDCLNVTPPMQPSSAANVPPALNCSSRPCPEAGGHAAGGSTRLHLHRPKSYNARNKQGVWHKQHE